MNSRSRHSDMEVRSTSDPTEVLRLTAGLLRADPIRTNVVATLLEARSARPELRSWWIVHPSALVGVGLQSALDFPPRSRRCPSMRITMVRCRWQPCLVLRTASCGCRRGRSLDTRRILPTTARSCGSNGPSSTARRGSRACRRLHRSVSVDGGRVQRTFCGERVDVVWRTVSW